MMNSIAAPVPVNLLGFASEKFFADLPGLLKTHLHKWVAYDKTGLVATADTESALDTSVHDKGYREGEYIILQVEALLAETYVLPCENSPSPGSFLG